MFNLLSKSLREKHLTKALNSALSYRLVSYDSQNVIGGGLEKPQGGIKEEKYFSDQNYNLMLQMRDHGRKLKKDSSIGYFNLEVSDISNERTALRESCCKTKQKNCLEEAFFLNEQCHYYAKLCKQESFKAAEVKKDIKTDLE